LPPKASPTDLAARVRKGDHAAASRALSIIVDEREGAETLARDFFKSAGRAQKVGVCGPRT
jgi:putative protein kinase ArgK-like GTPase of G3E family